MNAFLPADILFPQVEDISKWAVIACDQFTSDPAYWERVRKNEGSPSTINLILPEVGFPFRTSFVVFWELSVVHVLPLLLLICQR